MRFWINSRKQVFAFNFPAFTDCALIAAIEKDSFVVSIIQYPNKEKNQFRPVSLEN